MIAKQLTLCESLSSVDFNMIQVVLFTICISWKTVSNRVIAAKQRKTSGNRVPQCRTRRVQTFTTVHACSLHFSFIAYYTVQVQIQHFTLSRLLFRVVYQRITFESKNLILISQAIIFSRGVRNQAHRQWQSHTLSKPTATGKVTVLEGGSHITSSLLRRPHPDSVAARKLTCPHAGYVLTLSFQSSHAHRFLASRRFSTFAGTAERICALLLAYWLSLTPYPRS